MQLIAITTKFAINWKLLNKTYNHGCNYLIAIDCNHNWLPWNPVHIPSCFLYSGIKRNFTALALSCHPKDVFSGLYPLLFICNYQKLMSLYPQMTNKVIFRKCLIATNMYSVEISQSNSSFFNSDLWFLIIIVIERTVAWL